MSTQEKVDPVKALADAISDALSPHLERGAGLVAVRAVNAKDNQDVALKLAVKIERNERGRYIITPDVKVVMNDTDKLETRATVYDPFQVTMSIQEGA
jgi:hypothetical protein